MANTPISVRLDEKVLEFVDAEAGRRRWSRNQVIKTCVEYSLPDLEREPVGASRKKIAEVPLGGGATEGGGNPSLPHGGKAQDGHKCCGFENITTRGDGACFDVIACGCDCHNVETVIYGRPYSGAAPPGLSERETKEWNESALMVGAEKKIAKVDIPEIVLKPRSAGLSTLAVALNARAEYLIPDGVPCGHAGCLSHVSHPCEGCGRIWGRRPIYNMEDNEAAQKNRGESVPLDMRFSEKWLREMASFETGGLMACSPEILGHMLEEAKTNAGVAATLHQAGVELEREILVRWGLAENYKPKMEGESDGEGNNPAGRGKARKGRRTSGGDSKADTKGVDGGKGDAVAIGKPGVNMQALRDICEGKGIRPAPLSIEPIEIDLCGFQSYNETDGENYVCGKEKHDAKVKHGEWIKI